MSKESSQSDIVAVYFPCSDLFQDLKNAFPELDIRNVYKRDKSTKGMSVYEKVLRKVTEEELYEIKKVDILVIPSDSLVQVSLLNLQQMMHDLPSLKWVQLVNKGVDLLIKHLQGKPPPSYIITRNTGKESNRLMAEYVVGQMISYERNFYLAREKQLQKVFYINDHLLQFRSLTQLVVGVMGLGALGLEVARSLNHFGCRIHGYTRTPRNIEDRPSFVDVFWHNGELSSFLTECDYLICLLPSTSETKGMLGGKVLQEAKKRPVLMNMGRGDLLSEKDLLRALEEGWISGAILDVFEEEPLPKESPLWKHPKVVLTPHVSSFGNAECRNKSILESFAKNYQRYTKGEHFVGAFDWNKGY